MQQILTVLSNDADAGTISAAIADNSGSPHLYLAPTVLLVDGDGTVQDALNGTTGVIATLNDDVARGLVGLTDLTQLDLPSIATLISGAVDTGAPLDDTTLLGIAGWIYGLSGQYATKKSDRPRDGETWEMPEGCLPVEPG